MSDVSNGHAAGEQQGAQIRTLLLTARNPDSGWPYSGGKRSRIEPTCWALLALGHTDGRLEVLVRSRQHEGWLVDTAGTAPNHAFNALAASTLLQSASTAALAEPILKRLLAAKGTRLPQQREIRQDNSLQAWSWVDGTFSWVEPTAWCLLLLKQRLRRGPLSGADERIRVAEQMLIDRACRGGGWNYGNSNVYGQDLPPYVTTTAIALLALQDRRDHPVVTIGLKRLQQDFLTERSVVALSLTLICFRVYRVPTAPVEDSLIALLRDGSAGMAQNENLLGLAMSLCALSDPPVAAFTIGAV